MTKTSIAVLIAHSKGYVCNGGVVTYKGKVVNGHIKKQHGIYRVISMKITPRSRAQCNLPVHRLVAYQKYGDKIFEKGVQVRHLDGDSLNNHEDNIAIGTPSDNQMDKPEELRKRIASLANRKHSNEKIEDLISAYNMGVPHRDLMVYFGMGKSTLSYYLSKDAKRTSWTLSQLANS